MCLARSSCLTMRLLERKPDGDLGFRESTNKDVPAYAILCHTWLVNNDEEVSFQDVEAGPGKSEAGWRKIQFCADKAAADGLRYFWIDTCCIDKKNNTPSSLKRSIPSSIGTRRPLGVMSISQMSPHMMAKGTLSNLLSHGRQLSAKFDDPL